MRGTWVVVTCAMVWTLGCGDDGPGGSFGTTTVGSLSCGSAVCGGDPTGTWEIAGICAEGDLSDIQEDCPGATGDIVSASYTGTVTYNADGTGQQRGHVRSVTRLSIPGSCLMGLPCSALEDVFNDDEDGDLVATCSGSGTCRCNLTADGDVMDDFTWEVSGDQLIQDGDTEDPNTFCVQGGAMILRSMGGGFTSTVVLRRQ